MAFVGRENVKNKQNLLLLGGIPFKEKFPPLKAMKKHFLMGVTFMTSYHWY